MLVSRQQGPDVSANLPTTDNMLTIEYLEFYR